MMKNDKEKENIGDLEEFLDDVGIVTTTDFDETQLEDSEDTGENPVEDEEEDSAEEDDVDTSEVDSEADSETETEEEQEESEESEEEEEQEDTNASMITALNNISSTLVQITDRLNTLENGSKKVEAPDTVKEKEFEMDDDTFENIMSSKEDFVKFLSAFEQNIMKKAVNKASTAVQQDNDTKSIITDFYNANEYLKERKDYVQFTAQQIASKNPKLSFSDILAKTAEKLNKEFGITKQKETKSGRTKARPRQTVPSKQHSKNKRKPELTEMQKQINEML